MEKDQIKPKIEDALSKRTERKFKQSVEVIFNFSDVNVEGEHKLNLNVQLPRGRGKDVEVGVFADGDMNVRAKKVSKHVLSKSELEEYAKDKREMRKFAGRCYSFIAQPDLMATIGKSWGIVLGPRGKMPQPVPPNANIDDAMEKVKNTVRVKTKKMPNVQVPVGTEDMTPDDLAENIMAVYTAVERVIHVDHISSVYVKTTMGEAVQIW
ncbi:MAG: 50S ribosomal protein L1 [Candidatus Altiarchaeales archaeon]|nr:50S ribosomal protein L1 [Candidatus Altiarchaeales archaeon]MBD3416699.1 50S ribosomal protein L1 [Candidatus Altiarchaeales archaeon]